MRPETLRAIVDFWLPEFERHGTYRDAVKMVVGNKIDLVCALRHPGNVGPGLRVSRSARKWLLSCACPTRVQDTQRQVSSDQGAQVARDHGCLYYETSAKLDLHVQVCSGQLVLPFWRNSHASS